MQRDMGNRAEVQQANTINYSEEIKDAGRRLDSNPTLKQLKDLKYDLEDLVEGAPVKEARRINDLKSEVEAKIKDMTGPKRHLTRRNILGTVLLILGVIVAIIFGPGIYHSLTSHDTGAKVDLIGNDSNERVSTSTMTVSTDVTYSGESGTFGMTYDVKGSDLKESFKLLNLGVSLAITDKVQYKVFDLDALTGGFFGAFAAPTDSPVNFALAAIGYAAQVAGNWAVGLFVSTSDTDNNRFVAPVYVGNGGDKFGIMWVTTTGTSPITIKRLTDKAQLAGTGFVQFKKSN